MKNRHDMYEKDGQIIFEHLFNDMHAPLFFYANKFINDKEAAKDLVQDTFLNLLSKEGEISGIKNIKYYLFKCVRNNCLNYLNHLKIENEFHEKEVERLKKEIIFYDTHQALVEQELHQQIIKAINELPEHYRIPFELSRFENLQNKEIAQKLEIPVRTVETKIYRAMIILRKKLQYIMVLLCSVIFQFFS